MKCALLQINPTVGALEANRELIADKVNEAYHAGAELIVTPELALSGYPPEDLILKDHYCDDCETQLQLLEKSLPREALVIIGTPVLEAGQRYNGAVAFHKGERVATYYKMILPNYGVFDEKRLFKEGSTPSIIDFKNKSIALHICEDSWDPHGKAIQSIRGKADLIVNLSASPYHYGKSNERRNRIGQCARAAQAPLLYCNLVGGQDELVFDGDSCVLDEQGHCQISGPSFKEHILYWEGAQSTHHPPALAAYEEIYCALKLGLKDYVEKTGFKKVVVALSGGIDSALVLAVAVDALGADRVTTVTMPSRFSSDATLQDALDMADRLQIPCHTLPIEPLHNAFKTALNPLLTQETCTGLTDENLQARIRGNLIMALSNEHGWLVLTTGNKSEMAMGYCTLYGDMCGGFALLKDVPKTVVFALCRWRNGISEVIPPSIIERPPSAELRADQKDTDSLPAYDVLDPILEAYVEEDMGIDTLIANGFDPELVERVVHAVELSEYKRRQSPPGLKITPRSFDRDRRMPIVNRYRN